MRKKGEKAVIVLYDDQKQVLLQDRFGISHDKTQEWGFFGGGIEVDETPEQALVREIQEELVVHITKFELLMTFKHFRDEETYNDVYLFIGPLGDSLKDAKLQEGRSMKLCPYTELKHLKLGRTDKDIAGTIEQYLQKK
jgi:mutator protein MutT